MAMEKIRRVQDRDSFVFGDEIDHYFCDTGYTFSSLSETGNQKNLEFLLAETIENKLLFPSTSPFVQTLLVLGLELQGFLPVLWYRKELPR